MPAVPNSTVQVLNQDSGLAHSNVTVGFYPGTLNVRSIVLWNLCKTGCDVGSSFSFVIQWIRNPASKLTIQTSVFFDITTPEGYVVERGTTEPVSQLLASLIPVRMQNL
jgi:hypothetical protein